MSVEILYPVPCILLPFRLRVDTTRGGGLRHAIDREQVRGGAHMYPAFLRNSQNILEGVDHNALKLGVDLALVPEEFLQPLHPLEIADSDAAGTGKDVGKHEYASIIQNGVGGGSGWAISSLADHTRLDPLGVLLGDLAFQRSWNENVAR